MANRMLKGKRLGVTILAVALAALLSAVACAPAPIVEKKAVVVGGIYPMTGFGAISMQVNTLAIEDYYRYFNEQEAIPGVSLEYTWGDTAYQFSLIYGHYERFVARGIPLIHQIEAIGLTGLRERFAKDKVVIYGSGVGYEEVIYPTPAWVYFHAPTLAEQAAVLIEYFRENWEEARPPRLAFVGIESPWGYEPQAEGTKYAQSLGFEVLPPEIIPVMPLDATTQLLRLKEEGADLVYIQALGSGIGPFLRDAERLGLLGQMQFAGSEFGMAEWVIEMAGVASEGYLAAKIVPWIDEEEIPGISLAIDNQMKYHGKVLRDVEYMTGVLVAVVTSEAIRRAIEDVGYDNLDGAAIKEEFDNMKDFDALGLARITYKADDHRGHTKLAVYQVRDGKIVRVTDWREAPMLVPGG